MSKWDVVQKPNQRSKDHGKKDHQHNGHEHGLGGRRAPQEAPQPQAVELPVGAAQLLALATYHYVRSVPPVRDQDDTPQCVAYSNAYDQAQQDRPEASSYLDFWEARFFGQIGGTAQGAYMTDGLDRRVEFGYPTVAGGGAGAHRIASYATLPMDAESIKTALSKGHGVLLSGEWFHSWFHPFASGKLPAPDYVVGGHAIWCRGWNDRYGLRIRNSWGTAWGVSGDCFMPYRFLEHMYGAYQSTDR